LTVISA